MDEDVSSISLLKTSSNGRLSHSSSSESLAILSPSVVNNPVFSSLYFITCSFLLDRSLAAKNGTSLFFDVFPSFFASILALDFAISAFARANCALISSFSALPLAPAWNRQLLPLLQPGLRLIMRDSVAEDGNPGTNAADDDCVINPVTSNNFLDRESPLVTRFEETSPSQDDEHVLNSLDFFMVDCSCCVTSYRNKNTGKDGESSTKDILVCKCGDEMRKAQTSQNVFLLTSRL